MKFTSKTFARSAAHLILSAGMALGLSSMALAQGSAPSAKGATVSGGSTVRTTGIPQRDTLLRMMKPIAVDFTDQRLEDIVQYLQTVTGADFEPLWIDDTHAVGLDKDSTITLKTTSLPALTILDKILERAGSEFTGMSAWQMSDTGSLQFGPRERLNVYKRVETYSIIDLLTEIPNYTDAPDFDLNTVLQGSGGRGASQARSPFRDTGGTRGQDQDVKTPEEKADDLKRLIVSLIESDQWQENGGSGGSITYFQGNFIVNAPDYMHRALNGYPYWPSGGVVVRESKGRRYVSLSTTAEISKIAEVINTPPVAGTAGGGAAPSGGGAGPGGSTAPSGTPATKPGTASSPKPTNAPAGTGTKAPAPK
ncbi:MAG: hypothetical protein AB7Q00_04250 [Phycisphaerales bacterium]